MKTRLLYLLAFSALLIGSSCRTYQKLVETGQYDRLIDKAVNKLTGKKKKNPDWVLGLELAFQKANERDLQLINQLDAEHHPDRWERVFQILQDIDRRQAKVSPLIPLRDKEGRRARFDFLSVSYLMEKARDGAAEHLYTEALNLLEHGRQKDRLAARKAYQKLKDLEQYRRYYKNTDSLIREAIDLGRTDILVRIENHSNAVLPKWLENRISHISSGDARNWRYIVSDHFNTEDIEYVATVTLHEMEVSPDQWKETVHHLQEYVDETSFLKDGNGNYMLDSLNNKIEVITSYKVYATVTEIIQEKGSYINGELTIRDQVTGGIVFREPFNGNHNFVNRAISYQGDERALGTFANQSGRPVSFPDDAYMLERAADQIEPQVTRLLLRSREIY